MSKVETTLILMGHLSCNHFYPFLIVVTTLYISCCVPVSLHSYRDLKTHWYHSVRYLMLTQTPVSRVYNLDNLLAILYVVIMHDYKEWVNTLKVSVNVMSYYTDKKITIVKLILIISATSKRCYFFSQYLG